jgi:hypothetical protein
VFATAIPAAQESGEVIHFIDIELQLKDARQIRDWATRDAVHQLRAITRQQLYLADHFP